MRILCKVISAAKERQEAKQIIVPLFKKCKYFWEASGAISHTQFYMQYFVQQGSPSKAREAGFYWERKIVLEFWGHVKLMARMDVIS